MLKRGVLIAISGIDGSGKTTIANKLVRLLSGRYNIEKGRIKYLRCRYEPKLIKPLTILGRMIFLRDADPLKNYNDYYKKRRRVFKNTIIAKIYRIFMNIDYLLQILIGIKIPLLFNKIIICDRYIIDTALEIYFDYGLKIEDTIKIINEYYSSKIIPRPDIQLILDVNEEEAMRRKNDIPHIDYIRELRQLYQLLANRLKIKVLCNDSPEKAEQIVQYIADTTLNLLKQHQ